VTSTFDVEDVSSLGDAELLAAVVEVEQRRRADYFRELAVVAELESRGVAAPMGYSDVAAILRESLRLNPTVARRQVRHARALIGDLSPSSGQRLGPVLPVTAQALAVGAIGVDHVETIRAAMAALPSDTSGESREGAEAILATAARTCEPAAVARLGREILDRLDQDGEPPDDDELADPHRTLHLRTTRRGRLRGSFDLDAETGAHLTNLIAGGLTPDKPDDQRLRTLAQRQGDAFAEIIAQAATDTDRPSEAGEPVTLFLSTTADTLASGLGYGLLDGHLNLSIAHIRRLSCDCHVIPAVFGTDSELLDIGRKTRTVPLAIRRALITRDKGCAFPGCERRAKRCHAHHIVHWSTGGPTALHNLVLLCGRHHRHIHHTQWEVRMNHGIPEFIPPPHIDPHRQPRRNPLSQHRERSG
jgi:hypothetical protein